MKKLFFLSLFFCGAAIAGDAGLSVSDAYARESLPGQKNSVAFMRLENLGEEAISLKKIYSEDVEKIEVHEHSMKGGKMSMRKIDDFSLAAGEAVEFKPSGKHLMLLGVKQPLVEGTKLDIKLCFETVCQKVEFPVVSVLKEQ